jgi:hypothetical protein
MAPRARVYALRGTRLPDRGRVSERAHEADVSPAHARTSRSAVAWQRTAKAQRRHVVSCARASVALSAFSARSMRCVPACLHKSQKVTCKLQKPVDRKVVDRLIL